MWKPVNEVFSDGRQGRWVIVKFLKAAMKLYGKISKQSSL